MSILIDKIERKVIGKEKELSAYISGIPEYPKGFRLWFRFSGSIPAKLIDRADPFLAAILPVAMTLRKQIIVKGTVSERLLAGCGHIMEIWKKWYRYMREVQIKPDNISNNRFMTSGALCFFSGGVDSFYTLLKNLDLETGSERISHILYVHGFDISLDDTELFKTVKAHLNEIAKKLGVELILAATNLRKVTDKHISWTLQHGPGLVSTALCLSSIFRRVYIASSQNSSDVSPWGTHILTDPLWSTESMEFRHDGFEASRAQKILWYLSKSETALNHLRVCYKNYNNNYNCGVCEKCIRTMINLRISGVLDRCKTFNKPLDITKLHHIILKNPVALDYLPDNLKLLEQLGTDPELEEAIRNAMRKISSRIVKVVSYIEMFDNMFFGNTIRRCFMRIKQGIFKKKLLIL